MKFTTGEIISVGTGKLCCPSDRLYVVLNHLTGDSLFTHQLPRAFRACEAWVRKQHPWLDTLDTGKCSTETWRKFLADAEAAHGSIHELEPLPTGQWRSCDPVRDAVELMEDRNRVIAVQL